MGHDRKYRYDPTSDRFVNRLSGEEIPGEEPVMLFRARDKHALAALLFYQKQVSDPHHVMAVQNRIVAFQAFADAYPDRMKEPGTSHHVELD